MAEPTPVDRNLAMEAVRITEAAAIAAARFLGRGDDEAADRGAARAMHEALRGSRSPTYKSPSSAPPS